MTAMRSLPSSSRPLVRVLLGFALAAAAALAVMLLVGDRHRPQADRTRVGLLREAFDQAADGCYARYHDRVPQLQACLAGAMEAHLQALGGADGPMPPDAEPPMSPAIGRRGTASKLRVRGVAVAAATMRAGWPSEPARQRIGGRTARHSA